MNKNSTQVKIAIQKAGRLTDDTLKLLHSARLEIESYNGDLVVKCNNFPVEILFVRDDDIPLLVESGTADLGIVGQNVLRESQANVRELTTLGFGRCTLAIAVPEKSGITDISCLKNLKVATSYPSLVQEYFSRLCIPVRIVKLAGSVEIAPGLGIADAVADITVTGRTLAANKLKVIDNILNSEAVLITSDNSLLEKNLYISELVERICAYSQKSINFQKGNGLVPAIIQDEKSLEVLMLGYMNKEAYEKTIKSGWVYFWSRARDSLWLKGETSGNKLKVKSISLDCDQDSLLIRARCIGTGVCHTGARSCFYANI